MRLLHSSRIVLLVGLTLAVLCAIVLTEEFWLHAVLVIALGGGAPVIALWGMRHRLTKARSESELTQRRIRFQGRAEGYQDLIDAIYYPLLLVRNARVAFANQAAQKLLGEHIVGQDIRVAIRHPAAAERLANAGAEHSGEPALLIGVGSSDQRWEMRVRSLEDGLKLVQLSDQSSRYAAEKMRTDFVANASHELRTPLAAIKGFIETLEDPAAGEDAPTRNRFLKIMFEEADRMQKLVEDLMSLSRIEAQKYHIPDQQVDLRALIAEVQEFFIRSRNHRDADFVLEIADALPKVMGDRAQLSQLLHNLVSNAFKYGNKNRPVQISALPNAQQNMIILSVSDEGDGIDASHIPRLTERFYRVDKGRSRSIGGTGLGLAIVKHITERHGGRLEIRSEVGVGTTVQVSLPTREALPL